MAVAAPAKVVRTNMHSLVAGVEKLSFQNKPRGKDDLNKDFSKLLDHSKKKLSSLDSQRVVSVVDDLIRRCELVTLLPYLVENLDRFSVMLGSDLCSVLKEYDYIQLLHTKAMASQRKSKRPQSTNSNVLSEENDKTNDNNDYSSADEQVEYLASKLSSVVNITIRLFRNNPAAYNAIKDERNERSHESNTFIDHLVLLREQIFARLVTTPGEEREKQRTTVQMMTKEKKSQALIKKLEDELNVTTQEKENMVHQKNEEIRKLKLAIQTLEQESDMVNRKLISDAEKIQTSEMKNSDGRKAKLQQEVIRLKQKLNSDTTTHRNNELTLRKRKYKIETEVENWIQKYDGDMTERQDELEELSVIYAEEKKQLHDLEERFKVLEEEYDQIMEERRIAQEKREEAERELRNMVKAATLLQAFWRAYKCRKALKAKQKKSKKGKNTKKKKK